MTAEQIDLAITAQLLRERRWILHERCRITYKHTEKILANLKNPNPEIALASPKRALVNPTFRSR